MSSQLTREQIPQFLRAIAHNRRTVMEQLQTGQFCCHSYYFVTVRDGSYHLLPPGRRNMELARKFDDYLPGSLIGALPSVALHGCDGIKINAFGQVTKVELKLSLKSSDRYTLTSGGTITVRDREKPVSFRSDSAACFEIGGNLASKEVDTYLVNMDADTYDLISIYCMPGSEIVRCLEKNVPKANERAKKMKITLSRFMKHGSEVFLSCMDSLGVVGWEDRIYAREGKNRPQPQTRAVRRTNKGRNGFWTKEKEDLLRVHWTSGTNSHVIVRSLGATSLKAVQSKAKRLQLYRP